MTQSAPSTRRKVALVTSGFKSGGGGVSAIARWLCDCLRATGSYTVDIHDLATSSRDVSSRRLGAPTSWARPSLRAYSGGENAVTHWGANLVEFEMMRYWPRKELTQALRSYDLIQVVAGGPALAWAVNGTGVPTVLYVATLVAWERQRQLAEAPIPERLWRQGTTILAAHIERLALASVDAVLVLNDSLLEYVRSGGHRRVAKALPGVDTTIFSPPLGGWRRKGYLLSVCRLAEPRKGIDRMVRAYAHMVEADESIPRLVLVGRGELPDALLNRIRLLGLEPRVTIRANVSAGDLPDLYRGASLFLQTSYEEGLGMSVVEAMACGLPVVSTYSAGSRETVVDGVTGRLVPQDGGVDVAHSVASMVLEILRRDGGAMGARARERCLSRFSTEVAIRRFTDTYDDLLMEHPHGTSVTSHSEGGGGDRPEILPGR